MRILFVDLKSVKSYNTISYYGAKMKNLNLFETLKERGYVYQTTNEEMVKKICDDPKSVIYLGIDPTADSLHVGHFFALMMLKYFQDAGHKCIVIIGGATAMIGDPTGKSDMRKMLSAQTIKKNIDEVKHIIEKFVNTNGENPALILDNADWLSKFGYVEFMREIGVHFNVNIMLTADAYTTRLQNGGLTFLEMAYMPMQAYDFVHLNKHYNCTLQIGGSDQWSNIVAGSNLARKLALANDLPDPDIQGLTCPLLTTSEGKKMGKTEKGTLWVAREKTSVYDFYQYFYNTDDKDTEKLLKLFTRKSIDEINALMKADIRDAKRVMAYQITKLVHGQEEADLAQSKAQSLFSGEDLSAATSVELNKQDLSLPIADLIVKSGLSTSKSEVKRMIEQNGYTLNGQRITDWTYSLKLSDFVDGFAVVKKGKKQFVKFIIK